MGLLISIDSLWRKHQFLTIMGLSVVAALILTAIATSSASIDAAYITLFIFIFGFFGIAIAIMVCKGKASKNVEYISSGVVKVIKRERVNAFLFKMHRHYETFNQYVPTSATFTAVSVGGVTTGGWDVQQEHYEEKYSGSTDKYLLYYEDSNNNSCYATTIKLSPADITAAKKDSILSNLIKDDSLVLFHASPSKQTQSALNQYKKDGNHYNFMNNMQSEITKGLLNEREMSRILSFLCGGDVIDGLCSEEEKEKNVQEEKRSDTKDKKDVEQRTSSVFAKPIPNSEELKPSSVTPNNNTSAQAQSNDSVPALNHCRHLLEQYDTCMNAWSKDYLGPCNNPQNCKLYSEE